MNATQFFIIKTIEFESESVVLYLLMAHCRVSCFEIDTQNFCSKKILNVIPVRCPNHRNVYPFKESYPLQLPKYISLLQDS